MKATTATSLEPSNLFSAFSEDTLPGVSLSTLMRLIFMDVKEEMLKTVIYRHQFLGAAERSVLWTVRAYVTRAKYLPVAWSPEQLL